MLPLKYSRFFDTFGLFTRMQSLLEWRYKLLNILKILIRTDAFYKRERLDLHVVGDIHSTMCRSGRVSSCTVGLTNPRLSLTTKLVQSCLLHPHQLQHMRRTSSPDWLPASGLLHMLGQGGWHDRSDIAACAGTEDRRRGPSYRGRDLPCRDRRVRLTHGPVILHELRSGLYGFKMLLGR